MPRLSMLGARIKTAAPERAKTPEKQADEFYLSKEWRELRDRLVKVRGHRCERPGCGATTQRIIGDHILEIEDGGAKLDPANVMLLCLPCHNVKTAQRRAERRRAYAGCGRATGAGRPNVA